MTLPGRALVTGATGFIGKNLTRALVTHGVEVHMLTRKTALPPELRDLGKKIMSHHGDLSDASVVTRVVQEARPDVVFHLAAYGTLTHEKDPAQMVDVNVKGTVHLLSALVGSSCQSIVCTGSTKEYPTRRTPPLTEETPLHPWDAYGASKAAATLFCQLFAERQKLPVTVLRLSPVYGPDDDERRFVHSAIRAARDGTPLTVTVGPLVRNFTYIDDAVDAYLAAGAHPARGEIVNVGGPQASSFDDIVQEIERVTGKAIMRAPSAAPAADDSWVLDLAKARRLIDWTPRVSLAEGLRRIVQARYPEL